ncbi:MAG: hypothetical protein IK955_09035 [Clostridia bacterium]|nr:hypothetical protein [Clostridia bacterium]
MKMKKIVCAMISFIIIASCMFVPAWAETALKLTDEVYPTEMIEGKTFSVYGIVSSDNNILAVTIGVYNEEGEASFEYTGKPGTKTYDIHMVDYLMTFSKLAAGDYVYKIVATDTKDKDVVLLEKEFKVLSKEQFNTFKLTDANFPEVLNQGQTFSVRGTITSDYVITSVNCSVRSVNGALQFTKTVNPGTNEYSVSNLDRYMTFSKLTAGEYVYKITASDQYNTNLVLLEKTFTVKAIEHPEEDYDGIKWNVIDLSYHNDIRDWNEIAESVDAVILRIGYRATGTKKIGADVDFVENYKNAKAQGLPVGCYFFSAALTVDQAVEEAEFVLKILKENNCTMEMPVYFDIETDDQLALSTQAATNLARAFCEKIEEGGYYTGIYCNKFFARDQLYAHQLADFHFWIAQYADECTYDGPYGMWQYSERGSVPGIKGYVDLNFCYYDYPQIIKDLGMSGYQNGEGDEPDEPELKPSYAFKKVEGVGLNAEKTIVYGIDEMMTPDEFTEKYLELKDGATVTFSGTVGGYIKTGTEIQINGNGKVLDEFVISVKRDTDMNSKINSSDALLVLQYAVGSNKLGPARRLSADSTGDGIINSSDALEILVYVVGSDKVQSVDETS